jgi:hypothetical protein
MRVLARFELLVPGCDCLRRLRESPPELLVLAPPVLPAMSDEPVLRHVPAVLLPPGTTAPLTLEVFCARSAGLGRGEAGASRTGSRLRWR